MSAELGAKVHYLEQRQIEDRIALASTNENLARTTQHLAVLAETVGNLQKDYQASVESSREDRKELFQQQERNRELIVRVMLILLAAGISYVLAGGAHP
jgi:hypothetical protein